MHITVVAVLEWLGAVLAFVFAYAVAHGIVVNLRKPRETWEPVEVQSGTSQLTAAMGGPSATIVLWRSSHGNVRTTTLSGKWTLAQIKGEAPSPDAAQRLTLHN